MHVGEGKVIQMIEAGKTRPPKAWTPAVSG
jgi:hypothetical protein